MTNISIVMQYLQVEFRYVIFSPYRPSVSYSFTAYHIDRVYNIVLLHIHIDRAGELISYTVLNGSHMNMLTFNMYYVNISTVPPSVDAEKENYKD